MSLCDNLKLPLHLLFSWAFLSHGAIPNLSVMRTGNLFFAASDLTTNGIPGLTNAGPGVVVSEIPALSSHGGHLTLMSTQAWTRRYVGPAGAQDSVLDMVIVPDGQVTVIGSSFSSSYDVVTLRYASDGTALWTNRYDSPSHSHDYASYVRADATGNAYVTGFIDASDGSSGAVIIKYSFDGTPVWTNTFAQFQVIAAQVDASENCVLALSAVSIHTNLYLITKLNPLGVPLWTNEYRTSSSPYDHLNAMTLDGFDGVIATGTDYGTVKYSPAGQVLWTNRIAMPEMGVPSDLAVDKAGNAIVTGDVWDFGVPDPPRRTYATMKCGPDGRMLWTNRLAPAPYQGGGVPVVLVDPRGDMVIIGGASNGSSYRLDLDLTKISANGVAIWTNQFRETNASGLNFKMDAAMDAAGNVFLMTSSSGTNETDSHFLTVKFNARGQPVWTNRFSGGGVAENVAQAIGVDTSGNAYVAGTAGGLSGGGDFSVVKYVDYLHYTPPKNFVGTDSFAFVATDPMGNRATNTVNIAVTADSLWFNLAVSDMRSGGPHLLHLEGAKGYSSIVLYGSEDLGAWTPMATNTPVDGTVEFLLPASGPRQFYRASQNLGL